MAKIPKVIHYCWFGGKEKPKSVKKCIESWKKTCPDFEIKEWNESNYDISDNDFMRMAAKDNKWSFVTDYVRLDILYRYGGIYLDTDVEVLKDLSPLCDNIAFMGFERIDLVNDGQGFGGVKGYPVFKEMLSVYDNCTEYIESPKLRTRILLKHGLELSGQFQKVADMTIYPVDYFSPKNYRTGRIKVTHNTYSIHHFDGSWHGKNAKKYLILLRIMCRIFGEKNGMKMFEYLMKIKDKIKSYI